MCFFKLAEYSYLKQRESVPLNNLHFWKYSFQKVAQFSALNNVLDAAASNPDACLWTDTYVLQLN
jgi:hypothetical protein